MVVKKKSYPKQRSIRLEDSVMNMFKQLTDDRDTSYNGALKYLLALSEAYEAKRAEKLTN